eukprot:scaffold57012_cov63-Cyclotella_meneghiniana.AAC.7
MASSTPSLSPVAKKVLTATRVCEIYNNMHTNKNKSSTVVAEEKKTLFNATLQKKLNLKEELDFRDQKKWRDLTNPQKNAMNEKELRHFLRGLERTRLDEEESIQHERDELVNEIKPLSLEMQEWLEEHQVRIMNEKNNK